jgi:hypothetical protein
VQQYLRDVFLDAEDHALCAAAASGFVLLYQEIKKSGYFGTSKASQLSTFVPVKQAK